MKISFSSIIEELAGAVNSPLAAPFLALAETDGMTVALAQSETFVRAAIAAYPNNQTIDEAAVIATATGSVWHAVRGKLGVLGFVVDIAANNAQAAAEVRAVVSAAYEAVMAGGQRATGAAVGQGVAQ